MQSENDKENIEKQTLESLSSQVTEQEEAISEVSSIPIAATDIDTVPLTTLERFGAQWRVWYDDKRRLHDVGRKEIMLGQLFTLVVVGAGSVLLEDNKNALLIVGTALLVYPVLAALMTSAAASLSTSVHHEIDFFISRKHQVLALLKGFRNALVVSVSSSIAIGIVAALIGVLVLDTGFLLTLQLAVLATILTSLIGFPFIIAATLFIRTLKSNPDDVTAPLESTVFSILTLLAIIYVSRFLQ